MGSLGVNGSYQTAEEIYVRNCSFNGTQNGARIKTWQVYGCYLYFNFIFSSGTSETQCSVSWVLSSNYFKMSLFPFQGGSGYARKILFEHITLIAVNHPIIIDQHYCNGRHDCANAVSFYFHELQ